MAEREERQAALLMEEFPQEQLMAEPSQIELPQNGNMDFKLLLSHFIKPFHLVLIFREVVTLECYHDLMIN